MPCCVAIGDILNIEQCPCAGGPWVIPDYTRLEPQLREEPPVLASLELLL